MPEPAIDFWHTTGVASTLALALVHLLGGPLTGTSVNPARSLGPALIVAGMPSARSGYSSWRR